MSPKTARLPELKIRVTPQEAKLIKKKALEEDTSVQAVGYALFKEWLSRPASVAEGK
jgi:hypothetical protein